MDIINFVPYINIVILEQAIGLFYNNSVMKRFVNAFIFVPIRDFGFILLINSFHTGGLDLGSRVKTTNYLIALNRLIKSWNIQNR